jgi:multicomponent Na+:H+ antiporter subunit B
MIELLLLLMLVLALGALLARNLMVTVVVIGMFSLVSSLFYFILSAPDVALTEAAVGTGIGTVVFIWIVRKTGGETQQQPQRFRRLLRQGFSLAAALVAGLFLILALAGEHPTETPVRAHIVAEGVAETGAKNLVTSIYLGYRAFDTLGETVVLILAVSGVMFLVERRRS